MIYLFHGSDAARTRAKAFAWIAAARAKAPEAPYARLMPEQISESSLASLASSQGLFFAKSLALIDDPFASSETAEILLESLSMLADSQNPIGILAPKLSAAQLKKIEPKAEKVFVVDATEKKTARGFNSGLVNALGAKNGPLLWTEIAKAFRQGDVPEMVHGLLHWKARDLMQKGSRVWSEKESRDLSIALIELLSDSRSGDLELAPALERFALSL
jgi:DNA polymerase III delta subunit